MHVKAGVTLQPTADRRGLMRPVVIDDQVHVEMRGDLGIELGLKDTVRVNPNEIVELVSSAVNSLQKS